MNYPQTLAKAKTLLQQKHHAQAVQTAASVLENLLVELYNELLSQSPPARQKQLIEAIEQVGSGQPLNKLTLGKLVGLYRASRAYDDLQKTLELSLTFLNVNALGPLVDIRNRAVHEGHEPDPAEAAYIVNQVELILRETNRLPAVAPKPSSSGDLMPWWHTAIPHRDIRAGRLNLRDFAVDLAKVIEGRAVPEYRDAQTFFRRTFLTRGLRATLKGVLRRLAGHDDGVAITQMATVFGGGKTHTLLALFHLIQHGPEVVHLEPVQELLADAGVEAPPPARVAAVDCAQITPSQPTVTPEGITLHILWGEIAYRLGGPNCGWLPYCPVSFRSWPPTLWISCEPGYGTWWSTRTSTGSTANPISTRFWLPGWTPFARIRRPSGSRIGAVEVRFQEQVFSCCSQHAPPKVSLR
jgi:hypothetical protein